MKIGIIGAGNFGATLAKKYVLAGHTVLIANSRGPETLTEVVEETKAIAVMVTDAVKDVDVVILSIPLKSIPFLPRNLFDGVSKDVIVIDTCNYYPFRDEPIKALEQGMPHSVWVSEQLNRPIIKAFNNIGAYSLANFGLPSATQGRLALPVAGDDLNAKKIVMGLVNEAGFDAIDAGTLAESWRQHPGTFVYCSNLKADEIQAALFAADKDLALKLRDLSLQKLDTLQRTITQANKSSGSETLDLLSSEKDFMNDMFITINRSLQIEPLLKLIQQLQLKIENSQRAEETQETTYTPAFFMK